MKPDYVATKTAWGAVTFWRVLFFWLVIPLIVMICHIIIIKSEKIEFYKDYIIVRSGVLNKRQRKTAFMGVISVSLDQSFFGRIFNYGDVRVDVTGKWDINTEGVADPNGLVYYLESRIVKGSNTMHVINN